MEMENKLFLDEDNPNNRILKMFLHSFNDKYQLDEIDNGHAKAQHRSDEIFPADSDSPAETERDLNNMSYLVEDLEKLPSELGKDIVLWESDLMERDALLTERVRQQAEKERRIDLPGLQKVIEEEEARLASLLQERENARATAEAEDKEKEKSVTEWCRALDERRKNIMARSARLEERARAVGGNVMKPDEEFRAMTDKLNDFKVKLEKRIQSTCEKGKEGRSRSHDVVKEVEAALKTLDEQLEKKNQSFFDSIERNKTTATAVPHSVREGSGDGLVAYKRCL